ncbi:MAG TPA: MBL fold metallo-hydrolase [Desulfobulbus sp.]|nr:MBL fold metallo-hydrolase [Desulfobulbus sp.]
MKFCVLGSGSRGNCTYVETEKSAILIDAGFSGKEIARRLAVINRFPARLRAIVVTHEHNDHIAGVGVLSRRFHLPVYANIGTFRAAEKKLGKVCEFREFSIGVTFPFDDFAIHPFAVSHDTADPVGFVVRSEGRSLGYCTDTGRITKLMEYHLGGCHGLILEANYDPQMLQDGPYPLPLKQRVRSNMGHLANGDAACFVRSLVKGPLQSLVLAHLSETNNHPDLAIQAVLQACDRGRCCLEPVSAGQDGPSPLITL